jgi:hypothetical protein
MDDISDTIADPTLINTPQPTPPRHRRPFTWRHYNKKEYVTTPPDATPQLSIKRFDSKIKTWPVGHEFTGNTDINVELATPLPVAAHFIVSDGVNTVIITAPIRS